ncbi:MAG: P13 family porin [Treponemataceae bacterium]|nr:P13 family porin [Treponemataceae bacterium]
MKKVILILACLLLLCGGVFAEVSTAGAVCMNLFIPIAGGIGSYCQGDIIGGSYLLSLEVASWVGIGVAMIPYFTDGYVSSKGSAVILVGGATIIGCRIAGIILPIKYSKKHGQIEFKDINPQTELSGSVSFDPYIDLEDKKYGLVTTVRY